MTPSDLKSRLQKSVDFLESELAQIRTGRANPTLLENLSVKAYGTTMTLKELASITVSDAQNLLVAPWDKSLLNDIAKAIMESDMHVNPVVGGASVRVPIPSLTEERRKEFAKLVSSKVEETKTAMRNIRQEAMRDIEKAFSAKEVSEDDKFSQKSEVEKTVKEFVTTVDTLGDKKAQEVLTV